MDKAPKPIGTRTPPVPSESHAGIEDRIRRVMPDLHPIVERLDGSFREAIPDLRNAVKWKRAYYGLPELGWIIEMVAYDVSGDGSSKRDAWPVGAEAPPRPETARVAA